MTPGEIPDDRRPGLQPPRFGLLTLLGSTAVFGGLFALMHYWGLYGAALGILFALCVAAHVLGNALGTRLRNLGDTPLSPDGSPVSRPSLRRKPTAVDFAPLTRLRERFSLGKRVIIITGLGATAGGLAGLFGVVWLADAQTAWHVFALGTVACAVLGGIWTFAAASFLQVSVGEFLQARRDPNQH